METSQDDLKTRSPWQVYILSCTNGSYYVGYTRDLLSRIETHNQGRGSVHTAKYRPVTLVYSEPAASEEEAGEEEAGEEEAGEEEAGEEKAGEEKAGEEEAGEEEPDASEDDADAGEDDADADEDTAKEEA